jgi:Fe-Mn family superoxide dismutase
MPSSPLGSSLTRREAVKILGTGAALAGLGVLAPAARAQTPSVPVGAGATAQPFVLPPLGYAVDALEPHIDARTMEIHHDKHHQAYVTNANKALADHPELHGLTAEALLANLGAVPDPIRAAVRNNVGGHVNHSFFWKILGADVAHAPLVGQTFGPPEPLGDAISHQFGSFPKFQAQFADLAMRRFGSGWAWLVVKQGRLALASTANQDSPLSDGAVPLVGLDVWEHAYYLKHVNVRADYVTAFWAVLNWRQAEANYQAALAA